MTIALGLGSSLTGDRHGRPFTATAVGAHRFRAIGGRTGYQAAAPGSHVRVDTDILLGDAATLSVWVSPLETLAAATPMQGFIDADPFAQFYPLATDTTPHADPDASVFALTFFTRWRPQLTARMCRGWPDADHGLPPYAAAEHLTLRAGHWYHLAVSFSRSTGRISLYVNGVLVGEGANMQGAEVPDAQICLGHPAFVLAGLRVTGEEADALAVLREFESDTITVDEAIQAELRADYTAGPKPALAWTPTPDWTLSFGTDFTAPDDLDAWVQQGCLDEPYRLLARETTPEGLLLQTPEAIDVESRMYLWSPVVFEGDIAVSFHFRPESAYGFAMLVAQASGMQREDFIADHPARTTGAMRTIIGDRVRNYYWSFYRRTAVSARDSVSTHTLMKNPWLRHLDMAASEPIELGTWHRALFLQEGPRIRCAVDGRQVLEAVDDPTIGTGPVLNAGRIGLRLMFQTRMWFTNVRVYTRDSAAMLQEAGA